MSLLIDDRIAGGRPIALHYGLRRRCSLRGTTPDSQFTFANVCRILVRYVSRTTGRIA